MKQFIITLSLVLSSLLVYADNTFNPSKAYQGHNAKSYLGETLTVIPVKSLPAGWNKWDAIAHPEVIVAYRNFMSWEVWDETVMSENAAVAFYQADHLWEFNYAGSKIESLRGKYWKVIDVHVMHNSDHWWVFELENIEDEEDKCYYVYYDDYHEVKEHNHGADYDYEWLYNDFNNFPIKVMKNEEWKKAHQN